MRVAAAGGWDDPLVRVWGRGDGLPENHINQLYFDRDGYLLVAMRSGLVRYDGHEFELFNQSTTPEVPAEPLLFLAEDGAGGLWAQNKFGLVRWINGRCQSFGEAEGLLDKQVNSLVSDHRGVIWIGTARGLMTFENGELSACSQNARLLDPDVRFLFVDAKGGLWVSTRGGLQSLIPGTGQLKDELLPGEDLRPITAASQHLDGSIAFLSKDEIYFRKNDDWEVFTHPRPIERFMDFLFLVRAGSELWFSGPTYRSAYVFSDGEYRVHDFDLDDENDQVDHALQGADGSLWFATEKTGLIQWRPRVAGRLGDGDGEDYGNTWTLCAARDGSIWVGSDSSLIRWQAGRAEVFKEIAGTTVQNLRSIVESPDGTIWIGSGGEGLFRWRNGEFETVPVPTHQYGKKIRVLLAAKDGAVWVGSAVGLHRLVDDEVVATIDHLNGVQNPDVRSLLETRDGDLMVGTFGAGLYRINEPTGDWAGLSTDNIKKYSRTNGLSSDYVWALHEDDRGVLWAGTDNAMNRIDGDTISIIGAEQGLHDDHVNEIIEDDHGYFWISSDNGVGRVSRLQLDEVAKGIRDRVQPIVFTGADGMPDSETNGQKSQPAGCLTLDGKICFPTTRGVAVFDPEAITKTASVVKPVITSIRTGGAEILNNGLHTLNRESTVTRLSRIEEQVTLMPAGGRWLEVGFTAPTFVAPDRQRFEYKIHGIDQDWRSATDSRRAFYGSLPPGRFEFEVRADDGHGRWGGETTRFAVNVIPRLTEQIWFYPLLVTLGLITGYAYYLRRLRYHRRLHALESDNVLLQERVRVSQDLHDGLGSCLNRLYFLADVADRQGAEQEGGDPTLKKIKESSEEALGHLRDVIWFANPNIDRLSDLLEYVHQHGEALLGDSGIELVVQFDNPPDVALNDDQRYQLLLVFKELLTNVARHSDAQNVMIRGVRYGSYYQVVIEDDGVGIESKLEGSIRNPVHSSSGLGLNNIPRRVISIGGRFELKQRHPNGCIAVVEIPIVEKADTDNSSV